MVNFAKSSDNIHLFQFWNWKCVSKTGTITFFAFQLFNPVGWLPIKGVDYAIIRTLRKKVYFHCKIHRKLDVELYSSHSLYGQVFYSDI